MERLRLGVEVGAVSSTRRRSRHGRDQRGELLLEVLVTIVIMATALVGGMYLLATSVKIAATHQAIVRTSDESVVVAEFIEQLAYRPCVANTATPAASTYASDMAAATTPYVTPSGLTVKLDVTAVTYLASGTSSTAVFQAQCPAGGEQGAQKLTIRVSSTTATGNTIGSDLLFIKRNDSCTGLINAQAGQTC